MTRPREVSARRGGDASVDCPQRMTSSAPAPPPPDAPADPVRRQLTPWIALAILFGALGTLFGAYGALSSLALSREGAIRMAEVSMGAAGHLATLTDAQRQAQTDFLERVVDVQWSLKPWRALTGSLDLVLSAGLLVCYRVTMSAVEIIAVKRAD